MFFIEKTCFFRKQFFPIFRPGSLAACSPVDSPGSHRRQDKKKSSSSFGKVFGR